MSTAAKRSPQVFYQNGMECLTISGDFKQGNHVFVKFIEKNKNEKDFKKAITRYITKYVIKTVGNDNLQYRAVVSALGIRPFTRSRSTFPVTVMRKVKNQHGKPLYNKYSIKDLTEKLKNGECEIKKEYEIYEFRQPQYEETEWKGIPVIYDGWRYVDVALKQKLKRLEVWIDGELYSWDAGQYLLVRKIETDYTRQLYQGAA